MDLPVMHAEELRRFLAESTGRPVSLRINDNAHSVIHARPERPGPGIRASIHRIFLSAEPPVLEALSRFLTGPTERDRAIVREFIARHRDNLPGRPTRRRTRGAEGTVYHLRERADALNQRHFDARLEFDIEWSAARPSRRTPRNVTLGRWDSARRLVIIHPMLDSAAVPAYYIDFVIYHELVHIVVPSVVGCEGRMSHHTDDFYNLERCYPHYDLAMAWEKRFLPRLIRAWSVSTRPAPPSRRDPGLDLFAEIGR